MTDFRAIWYNVGSYTVYLMDYQGKQNIRIKQGNGSAINFDSTPNHAEIVYTAMTRGVAKDANGTVSGIRLTPWIDWLHSYKANCQIGDQTLGDTFARIREFSRIFPKLHMQDTSHITPHTRFTVKVCCDGDKEDNDYAHDYASRMIGVNFPHQHHGMEKGITLLWEQIKNHHILNKVYQSPGKEANLWPGFDVGCYVSISQAP